MAFKLTRDELTLRTKLVLTLEESGKTLSTAVDEFNTQMLTAWNKVVKSQEDYNKNVADAQQFVESVHTLRTAEFDAKSEAWQDGDTGQKVSNWLEEWTILLDDCDLEPPEPIEIGDLASIMLEELPAEPT